MSRNRNHHPVLIEELEEENDLDDIMDYPYVTATSYPIPNSRPVRVQNRVVARTRRGNHPTGVYLLMWLALCWICSYFGFQMYTNFPDWIVWKILAGGAMFCFAEVIYNLFA